MSAPVTLDPAVLATLVAALDCGCVGVCWQMSGAPTGHVAPERAAVAEAVQIARLALAEVEA